MQKWIWGSILCACLVACFGTTRNPEACCETIEECARLNTPDAILCEVGSCVNFKCVEGTNACDSADDCETLLCVNGTCMPPPPPPVDAPPEIAAFDVAYPNVWRQSDFLIETFTLCMVIVNTTDAPLNLSSLSLKSVADDHPVANVRLLIKPDLNVIIAPHKAAGLANGLCAAKLIDSGLVPEVRVDTMTSYVDYEVQDAPIGTYDITTNAVFSLDNVDVPIQFVIHIVTGPVVYADPEQGTRVKLTR